MQTPFTERKEVNLDGNEEEDMNTNSDDDDLEITF